MIQDDALFVFLKNAWIFAGAPLLSAAGFSLGIRINKNNSDRQKKREIYQNLYSYFSTLKSGVENNRPLTRAAVYGIRPQTNWNLLELTNNGGDSLLPFGYGHRLKEIEIRCFSISETFHSVSMELTNLLRLKYSLVGNGMTSAASGIRYVNIPVIDFTSAETIQQRIAMLDQHKEYGAYIEYNNNGRMEYNINIMTNSFMMGNHTQFIRDVENEVKQLSSVHFYNAERSSISNDIDNLCRDLHRRIGDPDPFWETVRATLADVFR